MPNVSGEQVTCYCSTKGRYFTTLPSFMLAVATQTVKPSKFILFDDNANERIDLREISIYKNIFALMTVQGIKWEVQFGEGKGQVKNHQRALDMATTEWIWRCDDDAIPEYNCLEKMLEAVEDEKTGAVGGLVLHPTHFADLGNLASAEIEDVDLGLNPQWYVFKGKLNVDHLYSTFLYRKVAGVHGYENRLSPVGHNEETMFTYQMKMAGWNLFVTSDAVTWHLREQTGGIRSFHKNPELWEHDKQIFRARLKEWGVTLRKFRFVVLDSGLGDHIVFKKVLQKMKRKFPDDKIVVACCYPDIFKGDNVKLVGIGDAKAYFGNLDPFNIYKFMWDKQWKQPLEDAFVEMYLK
jgi:hypothetical protein